MFIYDISFRRKRVTTFAYDEQHKNNTRRLSNLRLNQERQNNVEPVASCSYLPTSPTASSCPEEVIEILSCSSDDDCMEITNNIFKEIRDRVNTRVPINVQKNLKELISQCKDGIWCASIPEIYK